MESPPLISSNMSTTKMATETSSRLWAFSYHPFTLSTIIWCLFLLIPLTESSDPSSPASLLSSNDTLVEYSLRVVEYERLIYSCLAKITAQTEKCVQAFNKSFAQHSAWIGERSIDMEQPADEKVRRYCCMQADFKDCWTAAIRVGCSALESRLTKWLPLQVLQELRTDARCHNYVLYPHKCRDNSFSLWQILAFLLLVPFVAFSAILFTIAAFKPDMVAYKSLKILRTNQEIDV